ncbi:MAG: hypothetical protein DRI90_01985 [Deltaproteobacteria bacterium]|nr:MAG: hypothetical protein DRI90_01985 [Deltaproteobacteria bacterium]
MRAQLPTSLLAGAAFAALAVTSVACSIVVDNALSEKSAAAAGAGGQGGTSAAGGGGTDPSTGVKCGDELLCVNEQRCCMVAGDPGAVQCAQDCPPDQVPIYCSTPNDCPEDKVCCAQYLASPLPEIENVACVVTCDVFAGDFLVCTDQPSLCTGLLSCKESVQLPAGVFVCSP